MSRYKPGTVPLERQQRRLTVAGITLQEDVIVPSFHEVIFPASLELNRNPGTYDSVVEPDVKFSEKTGLLMGRVLAQVTDLQAPVCILNLMILSSIQTLTMVEKPILSTESTQEFPDPLLRRLPFHMPEEVDKQIESVKRRNSTQS